MKGFIIINPFLVPQESVYQAERLKSEFENKGVSVEIISDAFLRAELECKLRSDLSSADFIIYLDKDKYQSQILTKLSVRLFNSHEAIRLCDDKAETYIALSNVGINLPKTIFGALCYNKDLSIKEEWADKIIDSLGLPVIVKESFGSMGKGVYKADDKESLLSIMEKVKLKPHLFQQYISKKVGVDVRVIVIGGKAVCAMERVNESDFRSNVARGGSGVKVELCPEFKSVAEKCAQVLNLDYCGVDLLYGENNEPIVCEVNSNAFIGGIESATGFNVAKAYCEYILNELSK
ncbi:MAG: RimK family alpha-L-glutamate ligase [Clostridia bacterium]|nr:RimK family alpha-L-glutamate ligase [Clostridia bacterium]